MNSTRGISRRRFTRDILALAAVSSTASLAGGKASARSSAPTAENDRSPGRDPTTIHRTTVVVNGLDPSSLSVEYLDMMKQARIGAWLRAEHQTLADLAVSHSFYDLHRDRIVAARTVREIRAAHAEGKIAQILGWQSAEQLSVDSNQGALTGPAIANLRGYYELGLRSCGIAYNLANEFGSGCLEPERGLTRSGRRLVEEIHKLRMILDVGGHTGEQTSLDALGISAGVPVICSHTNIKSLNDNRRSTSDRLLVAIAETGGVIGVTAFSDFHMRTEQDVAVSRSPQAGLEKHLDQYDYLKKLVGVDHVGLGPDFIHGGTKPVPYGFQATSAIRGEKIPDTNPNGSEQFASAEAYSVERPWQYVKGFENIAELPNVTRGLIRRGWSTGEIRKVLGENWLRVYEKVWGG